MDSTISSNERHYVDFFRGIEIKMDRFSKDNNSFYVSLDVSNVPLEVAENFFDEFVKVVLPSSWHEGNRK